MALYAWGMYLDAVISQRPCCNVLVGLPRPRLARRGIGD